MVHSFVYFTDSDGEEVWEDEDQESDEADEGASIYENQPSLPNFQEESSQENKSAQSLLNWMVGFLFVLQAKHNIPNSALNLIIKFLYHFLGVLGRFSSFVHILHKCFPSSIHAMRKPFHSKLYFEKFPVCPKCNKVYDSSENCVMRVGGKVSSRRCNHVEFPNHPYQSMRSECNAALMKSIQFLSGREQLYPYKVYCYSGIMRPLQGLLLRPNFFSNCQSWRSKQMTNLLSDIYDGQVWKDFLQHAGKAFLESPFTFGLMMNIDWFQPYSHTVASVGVIYLTLMNLPRSIRFKLENIVIVGIIPGPSKPHHNINSYLDPLVNELLQLWRGEKFQICTPNGIVEQTVRCALLCVCCDLPAGRKVCGFLSFTAKFGCSRCMKEFSGSFGDRNYAGFDRSNWPVRSLSQHKDNVKKLKKCRTKKELKDSESLLGCRYSVLLDLPYFNPVRFLTIDPMHNLFLGTGKRMLSLWMEKDMIRSADLEKIQKFVDNTCVPSDIGRIPSKIRSGFSGFKADQFKNWINIYSIPALYDILSSEHLECWRHFVLACRILCKQSLSHVEVDIADSLLIQFCKRVERLFGESAITPNMHLHGHIKDILLDYGPVQEFWCFSFERFNGILGKQPSNNRLIEPQLLKQFLFNGVSESYDFPTEFSDDFAHLKLDTMHRSRVSGSTLETLFTLDFVLPKCYKRCVLNADDQEFVTKLYSLLNQHCLDVSVNKVYKKYASMR